MINFIVGDFSTGSICGGDDLIPLLGPRSDPASPPNNADVIGWKNKRSLLSLFSFSYSSISSSSSSSSSSIPSISVLNKRINNILKEEEDDDENGINYSLQLLERNAFCGINAGISDHEKHQLTSESSLMLILLELLKNKKAFEYFLTNQSNLNLNINAHTLLPKHVDRKQSHNHMGYHGRRLISHLCKRLILNVSDSDSSSSSSSRSRGSRGQLGQGHGHRDNVAFSMTTIKLKVWFVNIEDLFPFYYALLVLVLNIIKTSVTEAKIQPGEPVWWTTLIHDIPNLTLITLTITVTPTRLFYRAGCLFSFITNARYDCETRTLLTNFLALK